MGAETKIEWTDHTFNPWIGCTKVSAECTHCYAERFGDRFGVEWGKGKPRRRTSEANWRQPLAWDRAARKAGVVRRVFCASLADVFDDAVPQSWRDDLFALIQQTRNLRWLLLTKRPENILPMLAPDLHGDERIWLGTTVGHADSLDRARALTQCPAPVLFLSMEPLLGPVVLPPDVLRDVSWIIAGGESGPNARPMHPEWARSLRDQAVGAGVAFLFKQWGEYGPGSVRVSTGEAVFREFDTFQRWVDKAQTWMRPGDACIDAAGRRCLRGADMMRARDENTFPVTVVSKLGKKAAGRILDGRTWDEVPVP